jgi:hypothetical protein
MLLSIRRYGNVSEANFTPQYRAALQRSYHSTTPAGQKRYDQWYGRPLVNCFNDTSRQEVDARPMDPHLSPHQAFAACRERSANPQSQDYNSVTICLPYQALSMPIIAGPANKCNSACARGSSPLFCPIAMLRSHAVTRITAGYGVRSRP